MFGGVVYSGTTTAGKEEIVRKNKRVIVQYPVVPEGLNKQEEEVFRKLIRKETRKQFKIRNPFTEFMCTETRTRLPYTGYRGVRWCDPSSGDSYTEIIPIRKKKKPDLEELTGPSKEKMTKLLFKIKL
jgi:hypothetical protein